MAQTPKAALESLTHKNNDLSLTFAYIDSIATAHPELQKHPRIFYYRSMVHFYSENYALAIEQLLEAKSYVKEYALQFNILNNMGLFYMQSNQYDLAINAYMESKKLAKLHNNEEDVDYAYENILITKIETGSFDAIKAYEQHFLAKDYGDDYCLKMENLGMVVTSYLKQNHYKLAESLITNSSIQANMATDCPMVKAMYYENWGHICLNKNAYTKALQYLDSVPLQKITVKRDKIETYEAYKAVYKAMGNIELATTYGDSIAQVFEKNFETLNQTNAKYVTENAKTKQTTLRNMKGLRYTLMALGVGVLLLLVWALISKKNRKRISGKLHRVEERYNQLWANHQLSIRQLGEIKTELEVRAKRNGDVGLSDCLKRIYMHLNTHGINENTLVNHTKNNVMQLLWEKAPFLSEQEKLVCFFFSLGLSHKKIGELLNKTEKSIDSYKYRINQKVKTASNTTLSALLNSIKSSTKLDA